MGAHLSRFTSARKTPYRHSHTLTTEVGLFREIPNTVVSEWQKWGLRREVKGRGAGLGRKAVEMNIASASVSSERETAALWPDGPLLALLISFPPAGRVRVPPLIETSPRSSLELRRHENLPGVSRIGLRLRVRADRWLEQSIGSSNTLILLGADTPRLTAAVSDSPRLRAGVAAPNCLPFECPLRLCWGCARRAVLLVSPSPPAVQDEAARRARATLLRMRPKFAWSCLSTSKPS